MTFVNQLKKRRVHFVGIGGIGMSGIAEILLSQGYTVSGSDIADTETTKRLGSLGAKIFKGHFESNLTEADVVIVSSAIDETNPEVRAARKLNVPIIQRAEMLGELMKMKTSIAIAGTHGKTTTTSMIATIVNAAGLDPTIIIGGRVDALGGNAKLGQGDFLVAEADESDKSFLKLPATIAIVTNIDNDHLNNYGTLAAIKDAFVEFINRIPFYGRAILCVDDENVKEVIPQLQKPIVTYGILSGDFQAKKVQFEGFHSKFEVWHLDTMLGKVRCNVPGRHNVLNSLAAIATGFEIGLDFPAIVQGLAKFQGVKRRFELKGEASGVCIIDDYGHHPTEIRATLEGARKAWNGRIVTLFQPHRYSRTQDCYEDFVNAFKDTDVLFVAEIYAASEKPILGISGKQLAEDIKRGGHKSVEFVGEGKDAAGFIRGKLKEGDLFITLGAGNVYQAGEKLLQALK